MLVINQERIVLKLKEIEYCKYHLKLRWDALIYYSCLFINAKNKNKELL